MSQPISRNPVSLSSVAVRFSLLLLATACSAPGKTQDARATQDAQAQRTKEDSLLAAQLKVQERMDSLCKHADSVMKATDAAGKGGGWYKGGVGNCPSVIRPSIPTIEGARARP